MVGPRIGPAPAMAEKWWAKTTWGLVGTKSRLSQNVTAGVGMLRSSPSRRAMNRA